MAYNCFLLLLLVSCTVVLGNLDCNTFDEVYLSIDDAISNNPELIPPLVRLAFHDCVGTSCDGCLNSQDGSNAGLVATVHELEEIYKVNNFEYKISRADFWQLAAHVALIRGGLNRKCDSSVEYCHFFDLQYYAGRKSCFTSPEHFTDDDAGDGFGDFSEVWRVLHGYFKLDFKEIVTLFGAHSLGGAHRTASGFKYNWQNDHLIFDNQYYKNLVSLPYTHEDVSAELDEADVAPADAAPGAAAELPEVEAAAIASGTLAADGGPAAPRFQYVFIQNDPNFDDLLMLNTDMSLWKEVKAIEADGKFYTGELTCPTKYSRYTSVEDDKAGFMSQCKDNLRTSRYVYEYANSLTAFYREFPLVWWKMVSHGYDNLKVPGYGYQSCGNCIPNGGYCVSGFEKAGSCCNGYFCSADNKCEPKN